MSGFIKNIFKLSVIATVLPMLAFGAQQPNPRGATVSRDATSSTEAGTGPAIRRSATSVIARNTGTNTKRQAKTVVTARPLAIRGATVRSARPVVSGGNVARSASKSAMARSGTKQKISSANLSRAGTARATAVFNDVSRISSGYSNCRDAYATCMDQLCANANDTYRRCFCSDRFMNFRDTSDKIDRALDMLAEFQNVNLDAVNKSAAEVNAMYTATAGEEAIKRDTSASQKLLDSISDILSGKTSTYQPRGGGVVNSSLGVLDLSAFSTGGEGDVFGSSSSVFDTNSLLRGGYSGYTDISTLEGADLYNAAVQQCSQITRESCSGDAMFNLARSAYSILVTQDCNAYEKNINAKKASLEDTVRTAEKYLREARLNEYRAHNSADMNACLTAVESAVRRPNACGENYERCLDYTGLYINPATGEARYSKALFGLNSLIRLDGTADVLGNNPDFDKFLDDKKAFAESALDTCRGIADDVWMEFKRIALIQISQAQDDKIEEVKDSCVSVMKECYDTQTGALNDFAGDTQSANRAIATVTARGMCKDRVQACAALYGDVDGCVYNDKTKKLSAASNKTCGLQSLLGFVDSVDSIKFAKGCEEGLRDYVQETCAPVSGDSGHSYPWGCRNWSPEKLHNELTRVAATRCASDGMDSDDSIATNSKFSTNTEPTVNKIVADITEEISTMLSDECDKLDGVWNRVMMVGGAPVAEDYPGETLLKQFYTSIFNNDIAGGADYGKCHENTEMAQCLKYNEESAEKKMATFDKTTQTCIFSDEWYENKCRLIGGIYENSMCYVRN